MMTKLLSSFTLFLVIHLFIASDALASEAIQKLNDKNAEYILLDSSYIQKECEAIQLKGICAQFNGGKINQDTWLDLSEKEKNKGCLSGCHRYDLPSKKEIPSGYNHYFMLLLPDLEFGMDSKTKEVEAIYKAFTVFGEVIGNKATTIWFKNNAIHAANKIDIERNKLYANKFGLDHTGPYLIITAKKPDLLDKNSKGVIIINLDEITPERVVRILNFLSQELGKEGINAQSLQHEEFKQRFLSFCERNQATLKEIARTMINIVVK